jgi:hypothetical protein
MGRCEAMPPGKPSHRLIRPQFRTNRYASVQLICAIPAYFEQLSTLFMSIGRTCPRNQEYLLLYPQSIKLKEAVCEYFIVTVQLCKEAVVVSKKPLLWRSFSALELGSFEPRLSQLASEVTTEVSLASMQLQVQQAEKRSIFELSAVKLLRKNNMLQNQQMMLRFFDACSVYDYQTGWKQVRKQGTVDWFVEESAYTNWIATTASSVLHCVGTLGSGKSVLTANVVDDLILGRQPALVAYFFCKYNEVESLLARTIIGSIARQILEQLKLELDDMTWNINTNTLGTETILKILIKTLSTHIRSKQRFFIVLDGVDECKEADTKEVLNCLARLVKSRSHFFYIYYSSRPDASQGDFNILRHDHTLSMSAPRSCDGMNQYVMDALKECLDTGRLVINNPEIIIKIRDTLWDNAHGM